MAKTYEIEMVAGNSSRSYTIKGVTSASTSGNFLILNYWDPSYGPEGVEKTAQFNVNLMIQRTYYEE